MANRWLMRASAAAAAVGLALFFGGGTAWAASSRTTAAAVDGISVDWTGNGTNQDGTCKKVGASDDLIPGAGQQGWLFILTSPAGNGGSSLSYEFTSPTTTGTVIGTHKGGNNGGTDHFAVYVPIGMTLVSASATNGTAGSNLVVSHCEDGSVETPTPGRSITSKVHLADHTVIDASDPGTAPASVHDTVTLTVTNVKFWSGTITENFYKTGDCTGDVIATTTVDVDQDTTMPMEDLLPQTGLAKGDYSYKASFVDSNNDVLSAPGDCEPFKIADAPTTPTPTPPTTTTSGHLPVTGSSLTGILVAGVALIAAGGAILFVMRRRRATAGN